ncbi:S8 family peptidase [Rhodococcus sp. KBS0724]|uniref:S8 family peptidase n=1 Tax=Rhodococcus sp. KBS0724 TaxID=1179674 RepID=UPI00110D2E15|nr:S8 family peptidase [Rhodococcus sp. KBS0724]TSD48600.1 S8 family peptidase [Rhodococcus sp. KBS0724]
MASSNRNFILGYGERLVKPINAPPSQLIKADAYTIEEAFVRLAPMASAAVAAFDSLPDLARPRDEVVGVITLHPEWIAKSYYPQQLLNSTGLRAVGSKPVEITPSKWTRKGDPEPRPSTDLFVAGERSAFRDWAQILNSGQLSASSAEITQIETIRAATVSERLKVGIESEEPADFYEIVLHATSSGSSSYILEGFVEYADSIGVTALADRRVFAGGLCFMPVGTDSSGASELSKFSFLRTARPLPRLRSLSPIERSTPATNVPPSALPDADAVDPNVTIAVFDGGLAPSDLDRWADAHDPIGIGLADDVYLDHGHNVTSALLFGSLTPGRPAERPFTRVHHHRVLDDNSHSDPLELFDVLERIVNILEQRPYEFVSMSIGPALPIEDDEVHVWTAKLDEMWSSGAVLAAVAVGNTGEMDRASGNARVQVPSDCVNSLGIGAADSSTADWRRAAYSSVGPGRSPGLIKPDVLSFGGGEKEPFYVYGTDAPALRHTAGTSFATPATIRLAAGVRAHFGNHLTPVALKALLINASSSRSELARNEVGWGRIPSTLDELVICPDGTARVVYQGKIRPGGWTRAALPLPEGDLDGMITVRATFCFFAPVDPQDPGNYTQAGLEVVFRPHLEKFDNPDAANPSTKSFFKRSDYMHEDELRIDAHKWETTLHRSQRFQSKTLHRSVFDIHYNAREGGSQSRATEELSYALVISLESAKTPDLYDRVVRTYATQLEVLSPTISIPITTGTP